jgi:hypothetical protein
MVTVGIIPTMAAGAGIQAGTVHGIIHGAGVGVIPIGTTVGIMAVGTEDLVAGIMAAAGITTIGIPITTILMLQAEG